jgi:PAS domain S-box-containing protein
MKKNEDDFRGAVLIAAPLGKDAVLASRALERAGIRARICEGIREIAEQLDDFTNAIVVAAEALVAADVPLLLDRLEQQPPWSDIPLILLTTGGGRGDEMSQRALEIFGPKANVTLLERPLQVVTLMSTLKVALRARHRQYEVRDLLEQRETVLAGISDAFSALDFEWRYTFVNDRVAELAGIPKEKILGRVIWEIFPDAVGGPFYQRCHEVMETRVPAHGDFFYEPWGRWLDTRIYPTKDGIVIFRADITDQKKQEALAQEREARLRESQERLQLATEAADIGTFDFFPSTGELQFSNRSRQIFGIPPEMKLNYDTYLAAIHPDDRHVVYETLGRVRQPESGGRFDIEYRAIGIADGKERWVAERGQALVDSEGKVTRFIGTMLEITDRKNAEILLQRAKNEAEEANRAKDRFLAMLSHELRTPLTPVLMTIASLRREPNLSDDLRHDLEVLHRNVELEALLIDDLLDLTRIAHGKLELHNDAVDVHGILEHALNICAGDLIGKKLLGGPGALAAGVLEPGEKFREVHAGGRAD